jgi:Peptidase M50B-like
VIVTALAAALARIGQVQGHLPFPAAVVAAIIAVLAVVLPELWRVTQHFAVIAHEGAHATVASATGRKVAGIWLRRSAEGLTVSQAGGAISNFASTFAGYLGPSAFGVAAAELIRAGYIVAVLWLGFLALIAVITVLRRSFGIVTVSVALLLLFGVAGFAAVGVQVLIAYAITWFLLVAGVWMIRSHGRSAGDAQILKSQTRIPAGFWSSIWLFGTVIALLFGAAQLI